MTEVKIPPLAEGIDKASISYWYHKVGDTVKEGEDLVELVTDKATFNLPSPSSGKLIEILANEGEEVTITQPIAKIE